MSSLFKGINPFGSIATEFEKFKDNVINIALDLVGVVCVIFIIWGGITYLTSVGNEEKMQKGKATLTWAIVGLIIVIAAKMIIENFVTQIKS